MVSAYTGLHGIVIKKVPVGISAGKNFTVVFSSVFDEHELNADK